MSNTGKYGNGDATFQAAGGQLGIRKLVDAFFDIMATNPAYRKIYEMHPPDIELSRDKLALFLCGWTGGPRLFLDKYGQIAIPRVHCHLGITEVERDMWLACMHDALSQQEYPESLIDYLLKQLSIPAERVRQACMRSE